MEPRLETANKVAPPYHLNQFPGMFAKVLGREIIFLLATSKNPNLEGPGWERIFAKAIDAEWKPSNIGLDDVVKGAFAWGAKTVKAPHPHMAKSVRLISGRNNPEYSFETIADTNDGIGTQVLQIWNGRVEGLRGKYKELRTVVLLKPAIVEQPKIPFSVFEFETVRFPTEKYDWKKNRNNNLEGYDKSTGEHRFTWQRHGSQFTIKEDVPSKRLNFYIKRPPVLSEKEVLDVIGFEETWIEIVP